MKYQRLYKEAFSTLPALGLPAFGTQPTPQPVSDPGTNENKEQEQELSCHGEKLQTELKKDRKKDDLDLTCEKVSPAITDWLQKWFWKIHT